MGGQDCEGRVDALVRQRQRLSYAADCRWERRRPLPDHELGRLDRDDREIGRFIAALDNDPELKGRIIYRCLKNRDDSSYWHLASAADDLAVKTLQQRDFFKHYTEKTRQVAGGEVTVTPIELIAETSP